jgi:hypothetical protein
LIAVQVGTYNEDELRRIQMGESTEELHDIVSALAKGLLRLVQEANSLSIPQGFGFGLATRNFLYRWGSEIGLPPEYLNPHSSEFRIAGALTFGMGFLRSVSDEHPRTAGAASLGDAYGHTVNLAFRLCAIAARPLPGGDRTPSILVDRRIGGVLSNPPTPPRNGDEPVEILPYRVMKAMKGIEEHWCYEINDNSRRRG